MRRTVLARSVLSIVLAASLFGAAGVSAQVEARAILSGTVRVGDGPAEGASAVTTVLGFIAAYFVPERALH